MAADITALIVQVTSVGIREASQALGGLSTSAANATKRVDSFMAAMQKLNATSASATTAMDAYMTRLREQAALMQSMRVSTSASATSTKSLAEAMLLLSNSINLLNQNTNRAETSQRRHNESMREAHALARGLSGSLGALWLTYGNFAGMAVGLAIGASLKGIVTVGAEIEHTLETIRVLGETTTKDIVEMRDTILSLGQGSHGPKDVALALSTLTLAGLSASESMKGVGAALDLATVGGIGVEKAAYSLVQVSTALGYTAEGFSRVADVIAKTAAVSMSSVDSISGAFKSAASVGELYGASLVDIGVGLAALSNLGIQGTAAGTALKNFYKDLSSGSDKSKQTFKDMKMSLESLRDADGFFLPLIDVIKKLDAGLGTLDGKARQDALGKLLGERGVKEATALVKMLHTVSKEVDEFGNTYANKLEEVNDRVNKSYAFAALGAIAMAQTSQNQMKSVVNTLQTVFLKAFQEISPQIGEVSRGLKTAFNSPEFIGAIKTAAILVADLTKFVVDHAGMLGNLIKGYIAFKAIGVAVFLIQIAASFDTAAIAARLFSVALGPIGIALTILTTAWVLYKNAKADATNDRSAINSLTDQVANLKEQDEKLKKTLELKKKGFSDAAIAQEENQAKEKAALAKGLEDSAKNVKAMEEDVAKRLSLLTDYEKKQMSFKGNNPDANASYAVESLIESQSRLKEAKNIHTENATALDKYTKSLMGNAKELSILVDAEAKAGRLHGTGDGELTGKPDKAAANAGYAETLTEVQGRIDSVKRQLKFAEEELQSKYKQGLIGEIALIKAKEAAEINAAKTTINLLEEKLQKSKGSANKQAVSQEINNAIKARTEIEVEASRNSARDQAEYYAKLADETLKTDAKTYAARGEHVKAFMALSESKHQADNERLIDNYNKADNAEQRSAILRKINAEQSAFDAGVQSAAVKEAVAEYEKLNAEMTNVFKGVQTASEGEGIAGMFMAASAASETYRENLARLKEAQANIAAAGAGGSPEDQTKADEAMAKLTGLAEKQRTMWAGVGESISKSLSSAFGDAGKAAGDFLMVSVNAGQTQEKIEEGRISAIEKANKSQKSAADIAEDVGKINIDYTKKERSARLKSYGDMAGAAKGFFKEGSTGYKVLGAAEKAFRMYEMASTIAAHVTKSGLLAAFTGLFVTAKTTEVAVETAAQAGSTTAVIAGETAKNAAKVPGVFMSFMSALGPWGMAAAGVAIAAVLGAAFGGGGSGGIGLAGHQEAQKAKIESQGTGTILGDSTAKSASIANSIELLAEYAFQELEYSNKMLTAMESVAQALTGVSKGLSLTQGLLSGTGFNTKEGATTRFGGSVFGGNTQKDIVASGITLSGSVGQIASNGGNAQQYENTLVKKSGGWFKKDKEWIEPKFKALDGDFKDALMKSFASVRDGILAVGEGIGMEASGLANTLNQIPVNLSIETRGLKGKELEEAVSAVFSAEMDRITGIALESVKAYQQSGEGLLETAVRVANSVRVIDLELESIGKTFGSIGYASVPARMALIDMMGGLEEFVSKTDFFKENFLSQAQQMAPVTAAVNKEMARLNISSVKTVEDYQKLASAQDLSSVGGQQMFTALMNLAPAFFKATEYAQDLAEGVTDLTRAQQRALDIAKRQRELDIELMEALGNSEGALAAQRQDEMAELKKLSATLLITQKAIYDAVDAAKAQEKALKDVEKARNNLDTAYKTESTALQATIDKLKTFAQTLKTFRDGLVVGAASPLTAMQKYAETRKQYEETVTAAQGGDQAAKEKLTSIANDFLSASKLIYASGQDYTTDFNRVVNETQALIDKTVAQESIAKQSLDALTLQVSGLTTVNNSVLTVAQAIVALQESLTKAREVGVTPDKLKIDGSHASGLGYVPKNGYIAELHEGEAVLTKQENKDRNLINLNQYGKKSDEALVNEVKALRTELAGFRKDANQNSGNAINANFVANSKAAETVVESIDEAMKPKTKQPVMN